MAFRVAVIGAGASGLSAIKCCLDEGLEPVCFERSEHVGGLWHFTPDVREGQACVMKSTVVNTSKEMMCFSDFPIPKDYPPFMHNKEMDDYLNKYADKFNLRKCILFQREVLSVRRTRCFETTGKWDITYRSVGSLTFQTETIDAVLVCTGHHSKKKVATWPGMERFKGSVIHSHDYKDCNGYQDKRVLVVGTGNSGLDITVELSWMASKVFLSTRRGAWITSLVADDGKPWDMVTTTRYNTLYTKLFPKRMQQFLTDKIQEKFDHNKFGLQPEHDFFAQSPSLSDELPKKIISGSVKVKGDIREFTEDEVIFEDGTVEKIDAIVLATGYLIEFPFIDKEVIDVHENEVDLFQLMYPPDLLHKTLAFIGCFQTPAAFIPIAESQCRLATRVFKGDVKLPTNGEMWNDVRQKRDMLSKRYVTSTRHTIQVDYINFMDELAHLNGHKPDLENITRVPFSLVPDKTQLHTASHQGPILLNNLRKIFAKADLYRPQIVVGDILWTSYAISIQTTWPWGMGRGQGGNIDPMESNPLLTELLESKRDARPQAYEHILHRCHGNVNCFSVHYLL